MARYTLRVSSIPLFFRFNKAIDELVHQMRLIHIWCCDYRLVFLYEIIKRQIVYRNIVYYSVQIAGDTEQILLPWYKIKIQAVTYCKHSHPHIYSIYSFHTKCTNKKRNIYFVYIVKYSDNCIIKLEKNESRPRRLK